MTTDLSFLDTVFWHATSDGTVLWNAKLMSGWTHSVSYIAENNPELANATTPYAMLHQDREKEEVWERVRKDEFNHLPSRMKALFMFTRREDVDRALAIWWKDTNPTPFQLLVPTTSKIHIGDSIHLNSLSQNWERDARRYWSGEMTGEPFVEAILHGSAWIPNIHQYDVRS